MYFINRQFNNVRFKKVKNNSEEKKMKLNIQYRERDSIP